MKGIWEISHDFIARLLDQILAKWRVALFHRLRPWLAPASLILWVTAVFAIVPFYQERVTLRAIRELSEMGATVDEQEGAYSVDFTSSLGDDDVATAAELLANLPRLQSLILTDTSVISLQSLDLSNTKVTDLAPLQGLTNLQSLDLRGTRVSDQQIESLKAALPKLSIEH